MARVRVFGQTITADPIEQISVGGKQFWRMTAREHTGRCVPGTEILVTQQEIEEMSADEQPADPSQSAAALNAAMAEERKTLPSVESLLAAAPKTVATPTEAVSVPARPT